MVFSLEFEKQLYRTISDSVGNALLSMDDAADVDFQLCSSLDEIWDSTTIPMIYKGVLLYGSEEDDKIEVDILCGIDLGSQNEYLQQSSRISKVYPLFAERQHVREFLVNECEDAMENDIFYARMWIRVYSRNVFKTDFFRELPEFVIQACRLAKLLHNQYKRALSLQLSFDEDDVDANEVVFSSYGLCLFIVAMHFENPRITNVFGLLNYSYGWFLRQKFDQENIILRL